MTKQRIASIALGSALVLSNGWWALKVLDLSVALSYRDAALEEESAALREALAVLPVAAEPSSGREQVLAVAREAAGFATQFEKDGLVWIGHLGYGFSQSGRLSEVRKSWE